MSTAGSKALTGNTTHYQVHHHHPACVHCMLICCGVCCCCLFSDPLLSLWLSVCCPHSPLSGALGRLPGAGTDVHRPGT